MNALHKAKALLMVAITSLVCSAPALAAAASKATWSGVVTYVVDGDTVRVRRLGGGKPVSIRIDGIDAPEICQAGGAESRDALKRRVLGKRIAVHGNSRDEYGRLLARIALNNQDQGKWMVSQGFAWSYRYRNNAGPYVLQQRRAKAAGLGLFSRTQEQPPVYPREFRKQHGSCYL